jgi:hypothetical protein
MPCSTCHQKGHNKRTCKITTPFLTPKIEEETDVKIIPSVKEKMTTERKEVQAHGFSWEKEIISSVYGATNEELKEIKYNGKIDLPAKFNRLDNCDLSIKTSGTKNTICMSDCLRVFDSVSSKKPIHVVCLRYIQKGNTKNITSIIEIDLTDSCDLLFGTLTRLQIEELDKLVKSVPLKRKPTEEEHTKMYILQKSLQKLSSAIYLNIKCDTSNSRLQCSFNRFEQFIKKNPTRVVAKSDIVSDQTNVEFRGGVISSLISSRRVF